MLAVALVLVAILLLLLASIVMWTATRVALFVMDNWAVFAVILIVAMAGSAVGSIGLLDAIAGRDSAALKVLIAPVFGSFTLFFGWYLAVSWIVRWKTVVHSLEPQPGVNWSRPRWATIAIVLVGWLVLTVIDALLTSSHGWGPALGMFICVLVLSGSSASPFVRWYVGLRIKEDREGFEALATDRLTSWVSQRLEAWAKAGLQSHHQGPIQ